MKLYSSVFRSALLSLLLLCGVAVSARTISGTVTDQTGETIISASVMVKGTTIGTVTDFDGNYVLDVPDDAKVLVFSYIGLQTEEVNITGNVINVVLKENSEVLEEVVVTGYGTTKKRDLVTSVASVSSEQLKDIPVTSAAEALQGKLSGVSVTTTEGSPDADVKIRVRGGTSLTQSSDPLYIVDGFPVSSIADIAPSDIASMDVLKDAAATAIYGAQGANGVIIITTKDTNTDNDDKFLIHFDYTGYMGWKQIAKRYDMLDVKDYVMLQYEAVDILKHSSINSAFGEYFDPNYADGSEYSIDLPAVIDYWDQKGGTDWQDLTFGNKGLNSNHAFSISGGNKQASFTLSYNRIDDEGIMYGSDYNRNNLSFKGKYKPLKGLTIAVSARYSNTEVLGAGTNTADDAGSKSESRVRNAIAYSPIELLKKDDSDYESFGALYDPITTIDHNYKRKVDNKLTLGGYVQYKFLKDFTLKVDVGYETRDVSTDRFYGPTSYYSKDGDGKTFAGEAYMGNAVATVDKTSRFRNVNTFEYAHKWHNAHNFSVLVGEETNMLKGELRTTYAYGFDPSFTGPEVFQHLGLAKTANVRNVIDPTDNMLSFFARANYDYMGRYYITATFRADASTRFLSSEGNQWGYFPSVAAAWRIIDERWMEPAQDVMSNFKLRLSYGTVGNNNVDLGYLRSEYSGTTVGYMYDGYFSTQLTDGGSDVIAANPKLKWETTVTRDLGLDYGFFNERLNGTFDLYWNTTKDLILRYKLATGGYNYQYRNIGSTDNKGVEFSINGVVLDHKAKNLSYGLTINANISHNKNTVVDLGGMDEYTASTGCFSSNYANSDYEFKLTPGSPIGDIYGYRSEGFYTADDFDAYNPSTRTWYKRQEDGSYKTVDTPLGKARPGMTKLSGTVNEDGEVVNERVVLGNTTPIINGGFGLSAFVGGDRWGKFDLNCQFTYSYGNDVLNLSALDYTTIFSKSMYRNSVASVAYGQRYSMYSPEEGYVLNNVVASAGSVYAEGAEYEAIKAILAEKNANATVANPVSESIALTDKFVEDASFLRLSALTIGYSLPQSVLKKAFISNIRIFFTASNLFCATNYSGSDPEVDTRSKNNPLTPGVDFSAFPKNRAFNFGLNVAF